MILLFRVRFRARVPQRKSLIAYGNMIFYIVFFMYHFGSSAIWPKLIDLCFLAVGDFSKYLVAVMVDTGRLVVCLSASSHEGRPVCIMADTPDPPFRPEPLNPSIPQPSKRSTLQPRTLSDP